MAKAIVTGGRRGCALVFFYGQRGAGRYLHCEVPAASGSEIQWAANSEREGEILDEGAGEAGALGRTAEVGLGIQDQLALGRQAGEVLA